MGKGEIQVRIDKMISSMGIASRREIAKVARSGGILVDGTPMKDPAKHIDPEACTVTYLGRVLRYQTFVYVMLNKPTGYVSATEDTRLPYVLQLLSKEHQKMELFPVGRLDRDTTGLMILTNNGTLAHDLLSPKHHVEKEYRFTVESPLVREAEEKLLSGILIDGGERCKSARLLADEDRLGGVIVLTEGKYHEIKRMMEALGTRVVTLERIRFAGIPLDRSLARGQWRELTEDEVALLLSHQLKN